MKPISYKQETGGGGTQTDFCAQESYRVLLSFRMRAEAEKPIKRQEMPVLWTWQEPWRRILEML